MQDTIFALSTVFGKSGIAIIRISGPRSIDIPPLLGFDKLLEPRKAQMAILYDLTKTDILDEVILLYFQSPNSFNGEDILEIECHGSLAIINALLTELSKIDFIRIAEPGEFTKIAFLNGKIDLIKAEGLADLLDAETAVQKKIAQQQFNGMLSDIYNHWRKSLISILSKIEALIDFPDDDIPYDIIEIIQSDVRNIITSIKQQIKVSNKGFDIINGIRVVISGVPNVGKSTLMNIIAQRDLAIVSDIAGTTRDVLETKIDLGGFSVILSDTAGIRDAEDVIEKEGVKRALKAIKQADINVILVNTIEEIAFHIQHNNSQNNIWLLAKSDLLSETECSTLLYSMQKQFDSLTSQKNYIINISNNQPHTIDNFLNLLMQIIQDNYQEAIMAPITTRLRQQKGILDSLNWLESISFSDPLEMIAQNIRFSAQAIGMITGKICIEEILDEIFSTFCIGK